MIDGISTRARGLLDEMRDRRLWIPAVALVAAIVAVPFLLGASEPEPVSPPAAAAADVAADSEELSPVVLAEQEPKVRRFQKRLDAFYERNPFEQQLTGPAGGTSPAQQLTDPETAPTGSGGPGAELGLSPSPDGGAPVISDAAEPAVTTAPGLEPDEGSKPDSGSGGGNGGGGNGGGGNGGGGNGGGDDSGGSDRYFRLDWTIDAKAGPIGAPKVRKDVTPLSYLPGESRPVVMFVGATEDGKALFVVSSAVRITRGDGDCMPSPTDCQYVELAEGQEHFFEYGLTGGTFYRVKVTKLNSEATPVAGNPLDR